MSEREVSRSGREVAVRDVPVREVAGRLIVPVPVDRPGVVTDPREVAAIASRVEFYARPWWARVGRRPVVRVALSVAPCKIDMPDRRPSPREVAA